MPARKDTRFLTALRGEPTAIPPIWLMRQAGRYLPEYRALRQKAGSFLELCLNPELATQVTLQPIDQYDFDAAILFADILLIPYALGQSLRFEEGEGPKLSLLASMADLDAFQRRSIADPLQPVYETVSKIRDRLSDEKSLIGFAGAPWTVATYMLAGGSMRDPAVLRERYYAESSFIVDLIDILTEKTIEYLLAQINAGADVVQLFDSWAGGLPWPVLDIVSVRPLEKICRAIKAASEAPVILFPKGVGEKAVEYAQLPGCDAIGIDFAMDPAWARAQLSPHAVVQGGLDPLLVVEGGSQMEKQIDVYLKLFHDVPYIFNLGHGLTPQTPPDHVADLVRQVRKGRK